MKQFSIMRQSRAPHLQDPFVNFGAHTRYIPAMDGLRAVSISFVLLGHFGVSRLIPGGFGVTVFFLISGFLITRLLLSEIEQLGKINLLNFYQRRLVRLAPALLAFVGITTAVYFIFNGNIVVGQLVASLMYYMNYYRIYYESSYAGSGEPNMSTLGILWSLAVEEHFYMIFPLIVSWLANHKSALKLLSIFALAALVWRLSLKLLLHVSDDYTYMATDARFDAILYGCILAFIFRRPHAKSILQEMMTSQFALLSSILILIFTFSVRNPLIRETLRYSVQGLALMPIVAALTYSPRQKGVALLNAILSSKPFVYVGKLSYSLYLWHYSGIVIAAYLFPSYAAHSRLLIAVCLAITFSLMSYYLVERPFISLRRNLGSNV